MSINQFITLCNELTIDFNVALENDDVVGAIESENDSLVLEILTSQF